MLSGPGWSRCPRGQPWEEAWEGSGTLTHHQQGASWEQRAGADRRPGQRGGVRVWGPDAASSTPPPRLQVPEAAPRAGDTHLRRRHPALPARSSPNSARLLPGPPGLGRGRRAERTNQRRPCTLAANGRLRSERSGGIPPPRSLRRVWDSPPSCEQWSNLTRSQWRRAEPLWGCTGGRMDGPGGEPAVRVR